MFAELSKEAFIICNVIENSSEAVVKLMERALAELDFDGAWEIYTKLNKYLPMSCWSMDEQEMPCLSKVFDQSDYSRREHINYLDLISGIPYTDCYENEEEFTKLAKMEAMKTLQRGFEFDW